jgi:hypothetical protein
MRKRHKIKAFTVDIVALFETRDDWILSVIDDPKDLTEGADIARLEDDPIFTFSVRALIDHRPGDAVGRPRDLLPHICRLDLSEMGERFLAIETAEQAAAFLQTYGPLHYSVPYRGGNEPIRLSAVIQHVERHKAFLDKGTVRMNAKEYRAVAELLGYQRRVLTSDEVRNDADLSTVANLALDSLDSYAAAPLSLELPHNGKLLATAVCKTVEEGMRAFVLLSRLAKDRWRICKHCGRVFERRTARSRMCSAKCISAATSEKYNKKLRPAATKHKSKSQLRADLP